MSRRPSNRGAVAAVLTTALAIVALTSACRTAGGAGEPPAAAAGAARAGEELAIRRELEQVNAAMAAVFNRGDYLGAARFYADDAQIIGPGNVRVTGRAAVDRYWTSIPAGATWRLDVLEVGGSRDSPWQLGRSTLVTAGRGGDGTNTSIVDFVAIWRRQRDGTLKLYIDMYVPAPRPAAGR